MEGWERYTDNATRGVSPQEIQVQNKWLHTFTTITMVNTGSYTTGRDVFRKV